MLLFAKFIYLTKIVHLQNAQNPYHPHFFFISSKTLCLLASPTTLPTSLTAHLPNTTARIATSTIHPAVGTNERGKTLNKNGSRIKSTATGGTFCINAWSALK